MKRLLILPQIHGNEQHSLEGEYWLNEAFRTNLYYHGIFTNMTGLCIKKQRNNRFEVWTSSTESVKSKMHNNLQQATMLGLKQRQERKLLFAQHTGCSGGCSSQNVTMDVRK